MGILRHLPGPAWLWIALLIVGAIMFARKRMAQHPHG